MKLDVSADSGFWIFGKKVLLPIGRAKVNYSEERIYAEGFTKEQAENLPEYDDDMTIDYDYEERVRMVYRGVEYNPENTVYAEKAGGYDSGVYNKEEPYTYDLEPSLYAYQDTKTATDRQSLKLYEERLVANKERFRAGGVAISKRVETETATAGCLTQASESIDIW